MNERNLQEGQWEDRKQWNLGVRQRGRTFWNRLTTSLETTRPSTIIYRLLLNWASPRSTRNAPWIWQCSAETCRSYHT
jgi:hypothetical protein